MIGRMTGNVVQVLRLMLVTDDRLITPARLVETCRAAVRGGVSSIELRLKLADPRKLATLARTLIESVPVPLLINDRLDVALAVGAAGAHLGPDDLPVRLARRIAPPGFLIGASVGSPGEVEGGQGADYWGVGPLRSTGTKSDAGQALGVEGFGRIVGLAGSTPCIAIGGVQPEDLAPVRAAGGIGVAVASGILGQPEIEEAARRYR
jgi:thiamine-phosphate pyrophosphorylase